MFLSGGQSEFRLDSREYDPEVSTILPRLREAKLPEDVQRIVHEEFAHWFSAEIAGPADQYTDVAKKIWEARNKFLINF
jgi:hypothetical protein